MKKAWPLIALGVAAYIVFGLFTLPADVVLSRLGSAGVRADGVSGTTWHGRAQVLRVQDVSIGSVEWDLHVLALFTGRAAADVEIKRVDGFAKTVFTATTSGRLSFDALTASLPLTALPPGIVPRPWTGTLNLKFAGLSIEDGWPVQADGTVEVIDLNTPDLPGPSSYKIVFPPDASAGDVLAGALSDLGGPLQVTGTVQLKKSDRSYSVQGLVAARPDAPPGLVKALEGLGPPDAEGRRQFGFEGTL